MADEILIAKDSAEGSSVPPPKAGPPPPETTGPRDDSDPAPAGSVPQPAETAPTPVPAPAEGTTLDISAPIDTKKPEALSEDIAKILKEVQLPERREGPSTEHPRGIENPARTFETALGVSEGRAEAKAEPTPPETSRLQSIREKTAFIVSPLHTLKDDLQAIIKDKKISLVRAVALEQEKRRGSETMLGARTAPQKKASRRAFGILFSILVLLALGLSAAFGVYTIMQERSAALPARPGASLVFSEAQASLPLDDQTSSDLKRILASARNTSNVPLGSITQIVPTLSQMDENGASVVRPATLGEFLHALGTHAPDDLIRSLGNDFFFGIHTVDKNAPLFVIPVSSYERAFAGMLAWESAMNADLAPVFTAVPDQTIGPDGLPMRRGFQDLVMRNYDVRALKDDAGNIELYYSFPTRDILIIAESPYSFTESLTRLRAQRRL